MELNYDTFDEWFELIKNREEVKPRFYIPFDNIQEIVDDKTDEEAKDIIRHLLFPLTLALDKDDYNIYTYYANNTDNISNSDTIRETSIRSLNGIEKFRRIANGQAAWEGLTWVVQFLPFSPFKAISAINNYLDAEVAYLSDLRIHGLNQCIQIIEEKFIKYNKGQETVLFNLKPREFEFLIGNLYKAIGYKTIVTPATRDGGKDIIATIDREDGSEKVYVECKLYLNSKLTPNAVRAFAHVTVDADKANRGVIYCTGQVSSKLKEIDKRIQIWTLEEIITLLNAHLGSDWTKRIGLLIKE